MSDPQRERSPELEAFGDQFLPADSVGRKAAIASATCAWCSGPASEFTDNLSRREYRISGLCQKCQDDTFGPAAGVD